MVAKKQAKATKARQASAPVEAHPFALMFPPVEGKAFKALVTSIKAQGFLPQFPIFTYQGKVLEGWTRHRASKEAGVAPIYKEFTGDDAAALAFVCAANVLRRHLTTKQKRELIAKVLQENPKLSDRQVAEMVGLSDKTVATERERLEATAEIPQSDKRVGKDGKERCKPRKPRKPRKPKVKPQPQPKTDALVRQAEERARQAESNFADMQARFFQANAEATALKAQMTAEPAAPQPDLKPAPDDPVQGLADDIVLLVRGHNGLTYRQVLAALDLARSLINIEQEVFDPDDEDAPTEPADEPEEAETDDDEPEEETPRRRRAKKPAPRTVPIEKAVGEAFDTFQELGYELESWADGMPEGLQNSYKYEEVSEAASTLQGIYQPTVNGTVAGLQIEIQDPTPTRKNDTRPARCAQAIYIIDTVVAKLKEVGGEEAAGLRNELTNAKDEAEEVVFPGMY